MLYQQRHNNWLAKCVFSTRMVFKNNTGSEIIYALGRSFVQIKVIDVLKYWNAASYQHL